MNLYGFFYGDKKRPRKAGDNNPKGPKLFLSMFRWHFGRLVGINLLFILACLPIITIPCAMTAMSKVLGLMLNRKICYPFYHFRRAFVDEWKRSSLTGWLFILGVLAACLGVWFYPRSGVPYGYLLGGLCLVIGIILVMGSIYLFPMIAFTNLTFRQLINNSLLLVFLCLPYSVLAVILDLCFGVCLYFGLPYTSPILPLLGFSLVGLIGNQVAWHAMHKYVITDIASQASEDSGHDSDHIKVES